MSTTPKYRNEADVKRDVKKLLDKHNWFWWMPSANAFGKSGASDFMALKSGVFMAIETKFENNTPTPMQLGFLNSVAAEDGFAFVVTEKRIEWLGVFLDAFASATDEVRKNSKMANADGAKMIDAIRELQAEV
jgi:hypothetical protein